MKTCLVLGATGFIGGHIAREAATRGWQVRALRRNPQAVGAIGDVNVEWINGDLNDRSGLMAAMRGCDVVFHSAGAYPHGTRAIDRDVQSALAQLRNVLEAARDTQPDRLIYTSSFTTIGLPGEPNRLADERDRYRPGTAGDAYYEAKWAMEVEALSSGLPIVSLNPAAVFGPGDVHLAVSEIVIMAAQGRVPFYFDATFGAIDVRDVAAAHLNAVECGRVGERYILSNHNMTLKDGLALIAQASDRKPPSIHIGPRLLNAIIAVGKYLPGGMIGHLRTMRFWQPLNNGKAVTELGLPTRPLADTLRDALAWFKANGYL
ncbi:MAG TPA: NAD-dependent epimerase/dehydratase family protein [Anaerolineae bacterium]|nr:NAD-dependent epimerase/dehydratase family protein [Anaerolineae bacterium]